MINRIVLTFLVSIMICSCVQKTNDPVVKKKYFPDEKVTVEQEFVNDTIAQGFYRQYYTDGTLKIESSFVSNLEHGVEKGYFESGQLKYFVTYDSGKLIGPAEWYYENGHVKTKYSNDNGKVVGDFFEYDSLGHLVAYGCRDFDELIKFEQKFLPDGKGVSRFGEEFIGLDSNTTAFHVGDTLQLFILVATPPNTKRTLKVTINKQEPDGTESFQVAEGHSKFLYEKQLLKKGKFDFVGTYTVEYSATDKSEKVFAGSYQVD